MSNNNKPIILNNVIKQTHISTPSRHRTTKKCIEAEAIKILNNCGSSTRDNFVRAPNSVYESAEDLIDPPIFDMCARDRAWVRTFVCLI